MKLKLTSQFLMSIFIIVIVVLFVNTAIVIGVLYKQSTNGLDDISTWSGEDFTRGFSQYITLQDGTPIISDEGLKQLEHRNSWLQFLNANGDVIGAVNTPSDLRQHYSPVELVNTYKYQQQSNMTVYVSAIENISFLIGVQDDPNQRVIFTYDARSVIGTASKLLLIIIAVDLVIAALIGVLFSTILTRPVAYMIDRIEKLKNLDFTPAMPKKRGIYTKVFKNLNDVSTNLEKHEEERSQLEKMRNEWIANVSHDMKTPLASIQGYAELLQDEVSTTERKEYVSVIERQTKYMGELLEDFNLTMRLRDHQTVLQRQDIKMPTFVREIVIDLLNDVHYEHRNISYTSDVEQLTANIDKHLLKRALLNFIYNALHHNNDDTAVDIALYDVNGHAQIVITDNGKGMSNEDVDKVFDRYYRGTNTENVKGTGLGMAIARDIIEAHGGTVVLESELGKGTKITVTI